MYRQYHYKQVARSMAVIAATLALISGVTFATLQSQQDKFTGNQIQTATANLLVSADGNNFATTQSGFTFKDIVPGGAAAPVNGYQVYLKNSGQTALALKLAVSSVPTNPNNVDLTKVNVILEPVSGGSPQSFTLKALMDAASTGGVAILSPSQLAAGAVAPYNVRVSMAADAVNGSSASLDNIDFAFSGVAQ